MSQKERKSPRPLVEAAGSYSVPRASTPVDLRLDANEGALPPQEVLAAARSVDPERVRTYPKKTDLEARLAEYLGARSSQVIVTAGGDDAIDRICRAFLGPGRNLLVPTPSFVMIANSGRIAGADVREIPWESPEFPTAQFIHSSDAETGVVAVVTPNNPTGFVASADDVRALSESIPQAIVLLDLAYVEFADDDLSRLALELPNVVAVRTFSKARGLAGLRVGYAFGATEWIDVLRAAGGPYPVSAISVAVAGASIELGEDAVGTGIEAVRENRAAIARAFAAVGVETTDSRGNFLLAEVGEGEAFRDAMAGMGIAVRAWPTDPRLASRSRVSVPADESDTGRVIHALGTICEPDCIIFDVDGVLCDVRGSYRAAIVQTCAHFGADVTLEEIVDMKARGDANNDWIVSMRLLSERGIEVELDAVTQVFEELYQGTDGSPGLWRHEETMVTRAWLEQLGSTRPLALVTGRPRRDAERFVETSGFHGLFDAVVCMEDAPRKPDPAPVELAMEQVGAKTAWFLGDTVDDVRAARDARVLPIGIVAPGEPRGTIAPTLIAAGAAVVWDAATDIERWLK